MKVKKKTERVNMALAAAGVLYGTFRLLILFPQSLKGILFIILSCIGEFAIFFENRSTKGLSRYPWIFRTMIFLSGLYVAMLIYYALGLLVDDILYVLLHILFRLPVPHRMFVGLAFCVSAAVTVYGAVHARKPRTVHYEFSPAGNSGQTRPLRVVQLSDLHIGAVIGAGYIRKVVNMVNDLQPDIVVITGDLLNRRNTGECPSLRKSEAELARLKAVEGVYAVTGNHDLPGRNMQFAAFLDAAHIRLIDDRVLEVPEAYVIGRAGNDEEVDGREKLNVLMSRLPDKIRPVIVLDHNPSGVREAVQENADLVLCGHTHGGQFFPCSLVTKFFYGKNLNHGFSRCGNTGIEVSSGAGFFQVPVRIGTDSEIVCIDIK